MKVWHVTTCMYQVEGFVSPCFALVLKAEKCVLSNIYNTLTVADFNVCARGWCNNTQGCLIHFSYSALHNQERYCIIRVCHIKARKASYKCVINVLFLVMFPQSTLSNCIFSISFGSKWLLQQVLLSCIEVVMHCKSALPVYCTLKWILSDWMQSFDPADWSESSDQK